MRDRHGLDVHGVNLVVVEKKLGLRTTTFAYDATTRDLVGARYESDTAHLTCGANLSVSTLEGGMFPGANCAVTSTQVRGDASTN